MTQSRVSLRDANGEIFEAECTLPVLGVLDPDGSTWRAPLIIYRILGGRLVLEQEDGRLLDSRENEYWLVAPGVVQD